MPWWSTTVNPVPDLEVVHTSDPVTTGNMELGCSPVWINYARSDSLSLTQDIFAIPTSSFSAALTSGP
jgi:hypothetical protein